ncbi:DoxX family protein [Streptomyces sp. NPDC058653]|uniref:DoxX family protein n=1 Tax=Streptomyces sp. NPDC058653 TaxID=3346576 RepID=UPI0036634847
MFIAHAVVGILLAVALSASAVAMATRNATIAANMTKLGVPDSWLPRLASLKAAGAVGLVVGLWIPFIGAAAAIGVVLYFLGAVYYHVKAKDYVIAPPAVFVVLAVAALITRLATA